MITPLVLFFIGLLACLSFLRTYLAFFPQTNVYIEGYNVHHLYSGAFFLIILSMLQIAGLGTDLVILFTGIASGLIVDQLVYLVTSKGGHHAYYGHVSSWGMIAVTGVLVLLGIFISLLIS